MTPQFLLACLVLLLAQREGFLHLAAHFPELFLTPSISNIAFGSECGELRQSITIKMKPRLCWINVVVSSIGHLASLYILFFHYSKADPSKEPTYLQFLKTGFQEVDEERSSFFPPFISLLCLTLSVLSLSLLLHLAACAPIDPLLCQTIHVKAAGIATQPEDEPTTHNMTMQNLTVVSSCVPVAVAALGISAC
jgi:hypothetical protein